MVFGLKKEKKKNKKKKEDKKRVKKNIQMMRDEIESSEFTKLCDCRFHCFDGDGAHDDPLPTRSKHHPIFAALPL